MSEADAEIVVPSIFGSTVGWHFVFPVGSVASVYVVHWIVYWRGGHPNGQPGVAALAHHGVGSWFVGWRHGGNCSGLSAVVVLGLALNLCRWVPVASCWLHAGKVGVNGDCRGFGGVL